MAFTSDLAKQAESGRINPGVSMVQRVWPEDSLVGLPHTSYPDLQTNPSLDTRRLMAEAEQIARRHWWNKINNDKGPDRSGNMTADKSMTGDY